MRRLALVAPKLAAERGAWRLRACQSAILPASRAIFHLRTLRGPRLARLSAAADLVAVSLSAARVPAPNLTAKCAATCFAIV